MSSDDERFLFRPLPQDLIDMANEIGGGDARAGQLEAFCRICPALSTLRTQGHGLGYDEDDHDIQREIASGQPAILYDDDENIFVCLKDPKTPADTPPLQSLRRYRVSYAFPQETSQQEIAETIGEPVLDWLWDGFNGSVVAFGKTETGKTHTLFGNTVSSASVREEGLCPRVLGSLFKRIKDSASPSAFAVGLSCFDVRGDDVIDLLSLQPIPESSFKNRTSSLKFMTVQVSTARSARRVLEAARARSCNWTRHTHSDMEPATALPNRAHSFVRVILYESIHKRVSTVHFVDLVGSPSLTDRTASKFGKAAGETVEMEKDRERQVIGQDLLAFSRVISELAQYSEQASKEPGTQLQNRIMSARDSKLTQILGPLLAGNSKTYLIGCISSETKHYLDNINTLRIASRSRAVTTACIKLSQVDFDELSFVPVEEVLPALEKMHRVQRNKTNSTSMRSLSPVRTSLTLTTSPPHEQPSPPHMTPSSSHVLDTARAEPNVTGSMDRFNGSHSPSDSQDISQWLSEFDARKNAKLQLDARIENQELDRMRVVQRETQRLISIHMSDQPVDVQPVSQRLDDVPDTPSPLTEMIQREEQRLAQRSKSRKQAKAKPADYSTLDNGHDQRFSQFDSPSKAKPASDHARSDSTLNQAKPKQIKNSSPERENPERKRSKRLDALKKEIQTVMNSLTDITNNPESTTNSVSREEEEEPLTEIPESDIKVSDIGSPEDENETGFNGYAHVRRQLDRFVESTTSVQDKPLRTSDMHNGYSEGEEEQPVISKYGRNRRVLRKEAKKEENTNLSQLLENGKFRKVKKELEKYMRKYGEEKLSETERARREMEEDDKRMELQQAARHKATSKRHTTVRNGHSDHEESSQEEEEYDDESSYESSRLIGFGFSSLDAEEDAPVQSSPTPQGNIPQPSPHPSTVSTPVKPVTTELTSKNAPLQGATLGEFLLLKRNYDSLMDILKHQESIRVQQGSKISDLEHELREQSTAYELQIDSLKIESMELRSRLRRMEEVSDVSTIFESYERDLEKLQSEIESLKKQNITLSQLCIVAGEDPEDADRILIGRDVSAVHNNNASAGAKARNGLRKILKEIQSQNDELKIENDSLKKKERQWSLHKKCMDDAQRKVATMKKDLTEKEKMLLTLQLQFAEAEAKVFSLTVENKRLNDELTVSRLEIQGLTQEILVLRESISEAKESRKREAILTKFHKRFAPVKSTDRQDKTALALVHKLEKELSVSNPKCLPLIHKLRSELSRMQQDVEERSGREKQMVQLLSELEEKTQTLPHKAKDASSRESIKKTNKQLQDVLFDKLKF